ncbi:glycosyltransferase family 2 protein [Eshraghiella crossota]|uniref:glycosyltransferase family 2 protein n=1 Tax=Eshraghiella crossota TaxID=45851 RepID=UPI003F821A32
MSRINHLLVLCAYKESEYLEECLLSLLNQTVTADIVICTSTPNDFIDKIAAKYGIKVFSHQDGNKAQHNFNYALRNFKADYITLCHQDDVYEPWYVENIKKHMKPGKDIILFTDYYEIRKEGKVYKNKLLKIKRLMNIGFKMSKSSRFIRNRVLSLGNPICCPSVTFAMDKCEGFQFSHDFKNSFDWDAWSRLARKKGRFVYIGEPLVGHRIHAESGTTENIADNSRYNDDIRIYRRYWPKCIADFLMKKYAKGMDSNN